MHDPERNAKSNELYFADYPDIDLDLLDLTDEPLQEDELDPYSVFFFDEDEPV